MRIALLLGCFLLAAAGARAEPATEVEAGLTRERLTNDLPDWSSVYLEGTYTRAPGDAFYGVLRQTERFDRKDTQIGGGLYAPLASRWIAQAEALYSGEHRVLPQYSLFGGLAYRLDRGWNVAAGARRNEYTASHAHVLSLGVERYFGAWRAAYTFYLGMPEGAGSASAHRGQLDYYYAERSSVGASFVTGREVENAGPAGGVLTSDVREVALAARHWLTPAWAVGGEAWSHKQGQLYRRDGLRLGVRYRF